MVAYIWTISNGATPHTGETEMTKSFQIENTRSGLILGVYQGETAAEALDAMARDAGFRDYAHCNAEAPAEEGEIAVTEVATVTDINGREIDMDAAVNLMDDDLREDIAENFQSGWDNPQAFLAEYARRHREQFGEDFAPYTGGAW